MVEGGGRRGRKGGVYLVSASCWEASRRVLICSETTPTARKPAQARPAPRPNLLLREEAIQSVDSAAARGLCLGSGAEGEGGGATAGAARDGSCGGGGC